MIDILLIIICFSLITAIIGIFYVIIDSHKKNKLLKEIIKKEKEKQEYYGIFKY